MHISVVGLGKLGSPLAAVLASKGFTVTGTDLNRSYVDALAAGRAPVDEPRLQELVTASADRLHATMDCPAAVAGSDITFVIVPTPSDAFGQFSNEYLLQALAQIGEGLRRKPGYHVVVITSTVMPGSTGGILREALESHSGRRVGADVGLCYNPEFIALGSVVRDMLAPDMILIGESDARAGDLLEQVYKQSCDNRPEVRRMNFVNAELTKIAVNTFVTTKISYANMLADVCDRLPEADVDVVTRAVGSDSRIGQKYLRGAIGYGGPCFPRDNVAFSALARSLGARADLAEATDVLNRYQVERVLAAIEAHYSGSGAIGVLGLSYKPDTSVVEQSQGLQVLERLLDAGHTVIAYDPKALPTAQANQRRRFESAVSAEACVRASSLVTIMTPWPEFHAIPADAWVRPDGRMAVIDCWRLVPADLSSVADVVYLGRGAAQSAPTVA